jgi:hypothetical protein
MPDQGAALAAAIKNVGHLYVPEVRRDHTTPAEALGCQAGRAGTRGGQRWARRGKDCGEAMEAHRTPRTPIDVVGAARPKRQALVGTTATGGGRR